MRTLIPLAALVALLPTSAGAVVSELRLGLLAHDVGVFGGEHERGVDLDAEVLFDSPAALRPVWAPRPHVGISVNSVGHTSQAYAGLTWSWEPAGSVFIDFSLGAAAHNGETDSHRQDRISLGSRVLFRESLSVGVRLGERHSLSLMLAHISNARLADSNEGMDQFGLRWGYKF